MLPSAKLGSCFRVRATNALIRLADDRTFSQIPRNSTFGRESDEINLGGAIYPWKGKSVIFLFHRAQFYRRRNRVRHLGKCGARNPHIRFGEFDFSPSRWPDNPTDDLIVNSLNFEDKKDCGKVSEGVPARSA